MSDLSNWQCAAADDIGSLVAAADKALELSVEKTLEAGRRLVLAKEECPHGTWLAFLARAGVPERKAQRMMTLARSGLETDTVSDLGGVTGALEFLRKRDATAGKLGDVAAAFRGSQAADGKITDIVEFERGSNLLGDVVGELDNLASSFESLDIETKPGPAPRQRNRAADFDPDNLGALYYGVAKTYIEHAGGAEDMPGWQAGAVERFLREEMTVQDIVQMVQLAAFSRINDYATQAAFDRTDVTPPEWREHAAAVARYT
jgi:hypothetical protein